jgi:ketosteroid isomerase-like protein
MISTLLLTVLLAGPRVPSRPAADSIAQVVLHLEAERRAAHLAHDADRLAAILADDFVDIGANGVRRTKQQNVDETRRGVIRWTAIVARNEQVTVFDSTAAVVTGEQEGSGTYDGQPFTRHVRYMRFYLRRAGRWQNVAAQNAAISP